MNGIFVKCDSQSLTSILLRTMSSMNEIESITSSIKNFDTTELMKLLKAVVSEMDKKINKSGKAKKVKKEGSMPKGQVPPHLRRPCAWVEFTLKHAKEHGWEKFTITQTKKNKETGEKVTEEIEMSGSVLHEGVHIYEDSITEEKPNGKTIIQKEAMSLSKSRWAQKESTGTHKELYDKFLVEYEAKEQAKESSNDEESDEEKKVVEKKLTKEEEKAKKEEEKKAKEAEKAAAKEAEKAAKEAEKAAEKAAKEAEKVAKEAEKAAKEAEKAAKEEEKKKTVTPVKKAEKAEKAVPSAPVKAKKEVKKVVKEEAKEEVDTWKCEDDGNVYPWTFKGVTYLRNAQNEIWTKQEDDSMGEWCGVYIHAQGRIDDSIPAPEFEEEE